MGPLDPPGILPGSDTPGDREIYWCFFTFPNIPFKFYAEVNMQMTKNVLEMFLKAQHSTVGWSAYQHPCRMYETLKYI